MDTVYTYVHTPPPEEYYSAIKNNEIMPVVATWIDLKIIILKAGERKTYIMILLITKDLLTKQTQSHRLKRKTYSYQERKGRGWDRLGV